MPARLTTIDELLASIPALLGFTPTQSLVLVGIHATESNSQITTVCRTDLDDAEPNSIDGFAHTLATTVQRTGANRQIIVVVDESGHPAELPHRELVDTVSMHLDSAGMATLGRYWLPALHPGMSWHHYDVTTQNGVLPDPRSTVVAAELTAAGAVTFDSREKLADLLQPVETETLQRRSDLLTNHTPSHTSATRTHMLATVRTATDAAAAGDLPESDEGIAALLVALADPTVRDCCITWQGPSIEALWTHLTRNAPNPWAAAPATLLTVVALRRGAGPMANIACERALAADPGYTLAQLMHQALAAGITPTELESVIAEAGDETAADQDDPTPPADS